MSDIKIQPSATGSATVTLTAPVSNTARTITLPDSTSTLLASDGSAANLTAIPAANITGTLPAISGASLTNLPAQLTGITDNSNANAITIGSDETITLHATGGNNYSGADSKVLRTASTQHTILSIETSSTGGHQAALELESNGNPVVISTAGTNTMEFKTSGAQVMNISSTGVVTKPLQPSFFAHGTSTSWQSVSTGGIVTELDGTDHNIGNHYNTSNGRFTVPTTGVYCFQFNLYVKQNSNSASYSIYHNGSEFSNSYPTIRAYRNDSDANDESLGLSWTYRYTAGDYIEIRSSGQTSEYVPVRSYFSGFLVG
jgi:hypothetical protein